MRIALVALALLLPTIAVAEVPLPVFPECGFGGECPSDYGPFDEWEFGSGHPDEVPVGRLHESEQGFGSGMSVDKAWSITTGRTDVIIAVMDSGIEWGQGELLNKHYLNAGELPFPQNADGEDSGTYDLNGDGVHNMEDWIDDPRVAPDATDYPDLHAHHMKDPGDLIATFSDGVDDDGNGYIDDISGWDFFWNDNDPYDEIQQDGYSHGSKEGRWSVAEGGGAGGGIGSCPNCMLLNIRAGDGFVADVNHFANATAFAVDSGASVIQCALGALNNTQLTVDAVEYAWDAGVTIIGSAADETAWHANMPSANHHITYVHAIRYDALEREDTTSWFAFSNCTNYGGRLDLSVPAEGCSSGATGRGAGVAGLLHSAGLDAFDAGVLSSPLTANEVYQLMIHQVDDIAFNPDDDREAFYPSHPGWDQFFGFGRPNAYAAVAAIASGEIPPEADLVAPDWFTVLDKNQTGSVEVRGIAAADRHGSYTWELQVAGGMDPRDTEFTTVASGSGTDRFEGALHTLDLDDVPVDAGAVIETYDRFDTNVSKARKVHVHAATLRLQVTDGDGRMGQMRKMIFVQADPDLMPGLPKRVGVSVEPSIALVDVDGDTIDDVVYATSDGSVHVADATLTDKPGWPQRAPLLDETDPDWPANHLASNAFDSGAVGDDARHGVVSSPAVGDVDGDGSPDVVVGTLGGALLAWDSTGNMLSGFPYWLDRDRVTGVNLHDLNNYDYGFFSTPALGDIDEDGTLDIVIGGMDGQVHVLKGDGSAVAGFPMELRHTYDTSDGPQDRGERIISSAAIGDVDGDGHPEIVIGTNHNTTGTYGLVYVISHDGQVEPGWPHGLFGAYTNALPFVGEGVPGSPAICDVDGDGKLEVGSHTIADGGKILRYDGTEYGRLARVATDFGPFSNTGEENANVIMINSGAWGDLDLDGTPDYLIGAMGFEYANGLLNDGERHDHDHHLGAWSGNVVDGQLPFLPAYPRIMEDLQFFLNPSVVDIDNDGRPEAINTSAGSVVHAFDQDGNEPAGWPKDTGSWNLASPTVGDADGDGYLEVWAATRSGYIFAWRTTSEASTAIRDWVGFRHDPRRTGNCHTTLRTYPPIELEEGCAGCANAVMGGDAETRRRGKGPWLLLLLVLPGIVLMRKRR